MWETTEESCQVTCNITKTVTKLSLSTTPELNQKKIVRVRNSKLPTNQFINSSEKGTVLILNKSVVILPLVASKYVHYANIYYNLL